MGGALGSLDDPYYSISFTRDKNFHKVARNLTYVGANIPCRFTFDGDSMSNKYSFKPFAQKGFEKGKRRFESEERIVSENVFDVPLDKYVISFDIIIEYEDQKEWTMDKVHYLDMVECIQLCKKNNIKINTVDGNGNPIPRQEVKSFFQKILSKLKLNEKAKSSPGRVKRAGASCKGSVTDLRARAKKYSGERGKMYHWCANMKSGRKKK